MNRIEQLIEELCPEGVEFKELWEVTAWDKKFNGLDKYMQKRIINYPYVLANKFKELELERGNVRLLSTGNYIGWTTEELAGKHLCHGEIVAIPWGGKANVKYYKGKFVTADNRIATSINTNVLLNKFLYYWMLVNTELIESFYRGAGIKHPSMKSVLTMKIPIPPLPIQQEIVTILDAFTDLDASLQAELEARRKQYEHYRNQLLNFEGKEVEWKTLGEISDVTKLAGFEFTAHIKYADKGSIIALRGLNVKNGSLDLSNVKYIDNSNFSKLTRSKLLINDMLFTYVGTVGDVALIDTNNKFYLAPNVSRIRFMTDKVIPRLIMHYFQTFSFKEKQINKYLAYSSLKNLTMENIRKFQIPIPPLSEQERIVGILDKFDALVSSTSSATGGIPAEIEARRKQYEYYREKLLSFEIKGNK